jgi:hypothetical protein
MNAVLFDEHQADKEVIESLLRTNGTLWRELEASRNMIKFLEEQLKRRQEPMSKILQDENGVLYFAKEVEVVAVAQAQKLVSHLQSDLTLVQNFLANVANGQANASSQDAPADTTSVPAAPADPSQTVAAPAAPADPNQAPADPNPQPAVPTVDANGNPVQPAPAPDLNLAQSEQPVMPPLQ